MVIIKDQRRCSRAAVCILSLLLLDTKYCTLKLVGRNIGLTTTTMPTRRIRHPCSLCTKTTDCKNESIHCDGCDLWVHGACIPLESTGGLAGGAGGTGGLFTYTGLNV